MINNRVQPLPSAIKTASQVLDRKRKKRASTRDHDFDSLSTVGLEESSYLKLRPFTRLDPSLKRLLTFFACFCLFVNLKQPIRRSRPKKAPSFLARHSNSIKFFMTIILGALYGEVVYDVNLRQSKLLSEQKRSTPLLTFVIVAYSWLTLAIPIICNMSLFYIGPQLFRFYSRTTATICNGMFFGKKTSVDGWSYYTILVSLAFVDAASQVVVLGIWPPTIDSLMKFILGQYRRPVGSTMMMMAGVDLNSPISHEQLILSNNSTHQVTQRAGHQIRAYLLDFILGPYANGDLGVMIKVACLMVQYIQSHAFLMIIIQLSSHYSTAIETINDSLDKYDYRRLLKQLIVIRDSTEQISLMISIPFASITILVFMRQIALNGVFIQSTMLPHENWAVMLQSFTCSVTIFMVFIYCNSLQASAKQTHRLKIEQTVSEVETNSGSQSNYEFLDYLDRLSKAIRITFFNIIAINKGALVGLYGHILTLTFVTS